MLFASYALREDSAGGGRFRGGLGVAYEIVIAGSEVVASFLMDRGRSGPPGVRGGEDGAKTFVEIRRTSGEVYRPVHITKDQDLVVLRGDRIVVGTPGGGGYGPVSERRAELVEADLAAGYVRPGGRRS